ncbi:unnamed protein product [Lymnaea stagnalis]|uniref:Poly [ADP-ribose] polymerase n=1 Tax=Lymnaea stagnalis TaxID=6523 RepID=A0AAV2H303_LYMST
MGEEVKQLQIKDLPPDITEDQLRTILSNKKRRGGGPVERINLDREERSAVVTFCDSEAVDIIFDRGDHLTIEGHKVAIYRLKGGKSTSTSKKKSHLNKPKSSQTEANKTSGKSKSLPKTVRRQSLTDSSEAENSESESSESEISESESSETEEKTSKNRKSHSLKKESNKQKDVESSSDLEDAALRRPNTSSKINLKEGNTNTQTESEISAKKTESSQSESGDDSNECGDDTDDNESDKELSPAERAERTIKFNIIDVTKSKDFYSLYLEDESISEGQFIESSIMIDGMRKHLFVTFKEAKDARALRRVKHDEKSNIAAVTLASEKDFNWHKNLIAVHGYSFESSTDKSKLKLRLSKRLKPDVVEILQYDEPRSLIVKLSKEQCERANLAKMIWKCSFEFSGVHLIAAPVEISNHILITGLSSKTDDGTIERYLTSKRSGGSPGLLIPPIERISPQKAVANFINLEAIKIILSKSRHELEGKKLKIDYFHYCLTTEAYEKHFESTKKPTKLCQKTRSEVTSKFSMKFGDEDSVENTIQNNKESTQQMLNKMKKSSRDKESKVNKQKEIDATSEEEGKKNKYKKKKTQIKEPLFSSEEEGGEKRHKKKKSQIKEQESSSEEEAEEKKLKKKKSQIKEQESSSEEEGGEKKLKKKRSKIKDQQATCKDEGEKKMDKKKNRIKDQQETSEEEEGKKKLKKKKIKIKEKHSTSEKEDEEGEKTLKKKKSQIKEQDPTTEEEEKGAKRIKKKKSHSLEKHTTPEEDVKNELKQNKNKSQTEKKGKVKNKQDYAAAKADQEINKKSDDSNKIDNDKNSSIIQESLPLKEHEKEILNTLNFFKDINVETSFNGENMIIRGSEENIKDAKNSLIEKIKHLEKTLLNEKHLHPVAIDLLKNLGVRNCINKKLSKKQHAAFLESKGDNVILHCFPANISSSSTEYIALVKKQIEVKEKPIGKAFPIFQSPKGSELITKLCGNKDSKACAVVRLEPRNNNILIVALRKCMYEIIDAVEKFMEENQIHTEHFMISTEEQEFIQRFLLEEYNKFHNDMSTQGISVDICKEKIVLQGSEDGTTYGVNALSCLRDKVAAQGFKLNYFGIRDFLADFEGQKLASEFEQLNSCLIREVEFEKVDLRNKPHDTESVSSTSINFSSSCKLGNCDIIFTCGDILDITVDGIINPFHANPLTDGTLGKAISTRGGNKIQDDWKKCPTSTVKITSAGNLKNIRKIIHCNSATTTFSGNFDDAKEMLQLCLGEAKKHGIQSLAIPFMVIIDLLKIGKVGVLTAMLKAVKIFLDDEGSSCQVSKIFFCDTKGDNVEDIRERCEAVWNLKIDKPRAVQDFGNKHGKSFTDTRKQKNEMPKFGPIKVDVKKDQLTKSETNAIVITVTENLDLRKGQIGKDVLRYGGASIQDELRNNNWSEIQPGDFVETNAGNLNCKLIMHARLSKYKGERSELVSLVLKILKRANELNLNSISFPALGTGGYKYSAHESALGIKEGIFLFSNDHKDISLRKIDIIIFYKDTETEQIFKSVFSGENDDKEGSEDRTSMGFAADAVPGTSESEGENNKISFGCVTLTVKCGDITKESCDVIANGIKASMDLSASGAVCKSILKRNGQSFQAECNSKSQEISQEGVTATSAGKLPCNIIIHINMDDFSSDLDKGLFKVLELAEKNKATSIAIPALGTAKRGANINKIKKMMFGAIEKFGSTNRTLLDIRLVVFKKEMISDFIGKSTQDLSVKQVKSTSKDDPLNLTIFHQKTENGKVLIQKFTDGCKNFFISEFREMSNLKNLTDDQIKDLQEDGLKKMIRLKVEPAKGRVHLEGLKNNANHIITHLYELQLHATKQNLGRNTGSLWEYKTDDKWERFEPIIQADLEMSHTKDPVCQFKDSKGQAYLVDFGKNLQYLLDSKGNATNKSTEIRRRDLSKEEPVPDTWDSMKKDEDPKLIDLPTTSREYQDVMSKLVHLPIKVKQIQRVQNKSLYQQYAVKKREIESRNPAGFENEKLLYHGTKVTRVDAINQSGFSRNYKSVAYYGDGVYFAVDPNTSVAYAEQDPITKERKMYQVRVLVGESVVTKQGDTALPYKPGKNYPYDSGTDGKGVLYVIFHDAQAYPEYLITFM